jgi:hypothetical protein
MITEIVFHDSFTYKQCQAVSRKVYPSIKRLQIIGLFIYIENFYKKKKKIFLFPYNGDSK